MENLENATLISVIMSVYNSKNLKLLSLAIDSILNQTYSNLEFIICNDCSTDEKVQQILEHYQKMDSRIVLLSNATNKGLAYSLNKCIDASHGQILARQDDDDISMPNRLEEELKYLCDSDVDFVGCNINLFDHTGFWGQRIFPERPQKRDLIRGPQFPHPALLVRREAYLKVGKYRVIKQTRRSQDYDLYMRMYGLGLRGGNVQEFLYNYYEGTGTYSKRKMEYRFDEVYLRYSGYKSMKVLWKAFPYIFRPIISGLIPAKIKYKKNKKINKIVKPINFVIGDF